MTTSRIAFLEDSLKKDGEDSFLRYALAKEFEKEGDFQTALHHFLILKENDPSYVGLYYHLGHLYMQLNQLETGLHIFETGMAIAQELKDFHALSELKNAHTNASMGL